MFKDRYKKANNSIPVNQELLDQLKQKAASGSRRKGYPARWASAAVAAAVIGVTLLSLADLKQFRPQQDVPKAGPAQTWEQEIDREADAIQQDQRAEQAESKNDTSQKAAPAPADTPAKVPGAQTYVGQKESSVASVPENIAGEKTADALLVERRSSENTEQGQTAAAENPSVAVRIIDQPESTPSSDQISGGGGAAGVPVAASPVPSASLQTPGNVSSGGFAMSGGAGGGGVNSFGGASPAGMENSSSALQEREPLPEGENPEESPTPEPSCTPSPQAEETPNGAEAEIE
ncbi:MAG: hypothetical protein SO147_03025 [Clostridia bacterium]|nr:hypothetical protein [Clostridia bacterium]